MKGQSHNYSSLDVKSPADFEALVASVRKLLSFGHAYTVFVALCEFVQVKKAIGAKMLRKLVILMKSGNGKVANAGKEVLAAKHTGCLSIKVACAASDERWGFNSIIKPTGIGNANTRQL